MYSRVIPVHPVMLHLSGVNSGNLNSERVRELSAREIKANTGLNYLNSERVHKLFKSKYKYRVR